MKRRCGECTLCCRLMPIAEVGKPAGARCPQQYSKGCRIYNKPSFPFSCGAWSCAWLSDESLQLLRPDRSGYVIDQFRDFVEINGERVPVIQIWVDPRRPNAHRDPALRAWLAERWESHAELGLVRFDEKDAITLLPPALTGHPWVEARGAATGQHTRKEINAVLSSIERERAPRS